MGARYQVTGCLTALCGAVGRSAAKSLLTVRSGTEKMKGLCLSVVSPMWHFRPRTVPVLSPTWALTDLTGHVSSSLGYSLCLPVKHFGVDQNAPPCPRKPMNQRSIRKPGNLVPDLLLVSPGVCGFGPTLAPHTC